MKGNEFLAKLIGIEMWEFNISPVLCLKYFLKQGQLSVLITFKTDNFYLVVHSNFGGKINVFCY